MIRISLVAFVVLTTVSCSLLAPIFGTGTRTTQDASPYAAAMADFSLCETAPSSADRAAAAARLAAAAGSMASSSQPSNPDHFYEMDRVAAAHERCQSVLSAR